MGKTFFFYEALCNVYFAKNRTKEKWQRLSMEKTNGDYNKFISKIDEMTKGIKKSESKIKKPPMF